MNFPLIRYLEWTKTLSGCRINLCPSSIDKLSLSSRSLDLSGIEISGPNHYGFAPLMEELASRYGTQPENVVTTLGSSQALFLACAGLLETGDRVLVEKPTYEPLWAVPSALAKTVWRIIDHMHVEGVYLGEQVALQCLAQGESIRSRFSERIQANLSLLREFIQAEERLSWVEPRGGVIAFPRVEAGFDGDRLAEHLREKYATCVVPGRFFESPRHFRIGFGGEPKEFQKGIAFLKHALDDLSG